MNYRQFMAAVGSAAVTATLSIAPVAAQTTRTITLESGTVIPVKLRDTLSSTDSRKGDRFRATLESEDAARSLRLPLGSFIEGTVTAVRPMEGKEPGVIALSFDRVVLPNESTYAIHGSLIGLDNKSVSRESNGRLVAKPDQKNKTLMYAGFGAGAGLLIGALTKGNTILDTLIGGGLGYLLGTQDKSRGAPRDVVLKPNTELGVRLDRPVTYKELYDSREGSDPYVEPYRRNRTDTNDDTYRRNRTDTNDDTYRRNRTDTNDDTYRRNRADTNDDTYRRNRTDTNDDTYRRNRTDQNGDPVRTDRDRNYDRDADGRTTTGSTNRMLNQYTDVRDNGEPIRLYLNGREVSLQSGARPYFSNGTVMVPAAVVLRADALRYSTTESRFVVYAPDETFTGSFDSRIVTDRDNRRFTLPATIQRRNGTAFVPMQYLALVSGRRLNFDRDSQTVELGTSRSAIQR